MGLLNGQAQLGECRLIEFGAEEVSIGRLPGRRRGAQLQIQGMGREERIARAQAVGAIAAPEVADNPDIGEKKKGDLSELWGHLSVRPRFLAQ